MRARMPGRSGFMQAMTKTQDWQLGVAEAVIVQREFLLQQQVQTTPDRGDKAKRIRCGCPQLLCAFKVLSLIEKQARALGMVGSALLLIRPRRKESLGRNISAGSHLPMHVARSSTGTLSFADLAARQTLDRERSR